MAEAITVPTESQFLSNNHEGGQYSMFKDLNKGTGDNTDHAYGHRSPGERTGGGSTLVVDGQSSGMQDTNNQSGVPYLPPDRQISSA